MTSSANTVPAARSRNVAARIKTPDARRYLRMLCMHFRHKNPTAYGEAFGRIQFPAGTCELDAEDRDLLVVRVSAPDIAGLASIEDVVARQLVRFALDEPLGIHWTRA
jgi:hypothetical protein